MLDLSHRVRVFVFRSGRAQPEYLLLRSAQGIESFWTPLHGPIGFGEKLESAIQREAMDEVGLDRPEELIDLQMPSRWVVGDEQVIEWNFGFRTPPAPGAPSLDPDRWADFRWSSFPEAYPSLELEFDRAAILRLHALIGSN